MSYNNSLTKLNNQFFKLKKILANIYFYDVLEKFLDQDKQHKNIKLRLSTLAQKKQTNAAAWHIDRLGKLASEIEKNLARVLFMILDLRNIYTKNLDIANKADKKATRYTPLH